jgi:hypothetical protein
MRRFFFLAPRLAALLGTSYLLIATSQVPPEECNGGMCGGSGGSNQTQVCHHANEAVSFHVTGTCGPEGDIVATSAADECAITVQGASAVKLPPAGRFESRTDAFVSLVQDAWTLSGYLPETAGPDAGPAQPVQPDAGIFAVVRDAQASPDVGGFSVSPGAGGQGGNAGTHTTPTLRTCTARTKLSNTLALACSGGGLPTCEATLTWY